MNNQLAFAVLGFLHLCCWIFFFLRLYVRIWLLKKPALDDLLVGLALVRYSLNCVPKPSRCCKRHSNTFAVIFQICYTAFTVFAVGIIKNGLGTDVDDDPTQLDQWSRGSFYFFFSELAFVLSSTLLRLACAYMLLRIVGRTNDRLRWIIWTTAGVMTIYSIVFFFVSLFQCAPVSYFWTYMYPNTEGSCINDEHITTKWTTMSIFFTVHSVVCMLSDWILGVIPFFLLRNLQISKKRKIVVIALLSLGILAGVVALIRIPL
jgi:hypothetical protein